MGMILVNLRNVATYPFSHICHSVLREMPQVRPNSRVNVHLTQADQSGSAGRLVSNDRFDALLERAIKYFHLIK